jgi:predicted PurR-regulated permease PerM
VIDKLGRRKRNIVLLLLAALLVWFAWSIRAVLNPVLLGYLCAFILHPFVLRIEGLGFSRRTAVNLAFVGCFTLALLVQLVLVLQVRSLALEVYRSAKAAGATETQEVVDPDQRPTAQEKLQERLDEFGERMEGWGIPVPEITISLEGAKELAAEVLREEETKEGAIQAAGQGFRFLSRLIGRLLALGGLFLLVPLYAYYFLFVGKDVEAFVRRHLPSGERTRIARVAGEIGQVVASFFRGRLGVCFVKGLILSVGLMIADVPYAFLFGMLSGFLSVIPFFGPFLGFLFAFVVAILEHGVIAALLRTGIVFSLGEMLEGYVLVPKILGDSLGLHPMVVFVALLAGGAALGMLGVLVALPLTAAAVILFKEFVLPAMRAWADEDADAPPAT